MIAVLVFLALVTRQDPDGGCSIVRVTACIQEQDSRDFGFCISGPGPVSPNELLKSLQGVTVITTEFHALRPGGCDEEIQNQCGLRPGDGPQAEDTLCAWEWREGGGELEINETCSNDGLAHGCYIFDLDDDFDLDLRDFAIFQNAYPLTDGRKSLGGDFPGQP